MEPRFLMSHHRNNSETKCFSLHKSTSYLSGFPGGSDGKESARNAGDLGLILGLGRSPGEGNGYPLQYSWSFPDGTRGKEPACQFRRLKRCRFNLWVEKILWRWAWQPTPVFLPAESQGWKSLLGYCLWGRTESDMTDVT